eukprot:2537399-Amphidinium_carterae.1
MKTHLLRREDHARVATEKLHYTLHPTSGYKTATTEIKRVYDGFEVENYFDTVKKKRTKDTEKEEDKTRLQKLLSISCHYTPTFFENLKQQNFDSLRDADLKKLKHNYINGLQKYWSSTQYYHNGLWTPGHYLAQYQGATWRILQTTDMTTTTSTRKYNTPSMTSLT